jgi:hypothetical protein
MSSNDSTDTVQQQPSLKPGAPVRPGQEVPVSSRTGVPLHKTVKAYLDSNDHNDNEKGMMFVRRVFALLVLEYAAVLMIVSPFCLIDTVQQAVKPPYINITLSAISFFGLVFSVYLVATRGYQKWAARTGLFTCTFFVAMALGLKLSLVPKWSNYALIALGQATVNFAMLHAVTQFDSRHLQWLRHNTGFLICLAVSFLWMLVLREAGCSWLVSTTVPLGGWLYAVNIIMSMRKTIHHREPHDYLRATIFILGPPIPSFLIPKRRTARDRWATLRAAVLVNSNLSDIRTQHQDGGDEVEKLKVSQQDDVVEKTESYGALDDSLV